MAEGEEAKVVEEEPEFISYLLNQRDEHDVYFFVGKRKTKIGAVRKMVAAHSPPLRSLLEMESTFPKKGIILKDMSPETFTNLLRYAYGYNNLSTLSFDEANDLLSAADKYIVQGLIEQVALRLMDLLNFQNICRLLNNPAYLKRQDLHSTLTDILRYETQYVFDYSEFLNLNVEGFVKILEQEISTATELEIWKAALKWAKNKASSEDGTVVRGHISELQHIRIHCLRLRDFCKEVTPTYILTYAEVLAMCASYKREEKPLIEGFSEKTIPRQLLYREMIKVSTKATESINQTSFTIETTDNIFLLPFEFMANTLEPSVSDYNCEVTIAVTHVPKSSHCSLGSKITRFNEKVNCGESFQVPLTPDCKRLLSDNAYEITITFNSPHLHFGGKDYKYSTASATITLNKSSGYDFFLPFNFMKYTSGV